jgi:hypothetical protein
MHTTTKCLEEYKKATTYADRCLWKQRLADHIYEELKDKPLSIFTVREFKILKDLVTNHGHDTDVDVLAHFSMNHIKE